MTRHRSSKVFQARLVISDSLSLEWRLLLDLCAAGIAVGFGTRPLHNTNLLFLYIREFLSLITLHKKNKNNYLCESLETVIDTKIVYTVILFIFYIIISLTYYAHERIILNLLILSH